MLCIQLDELPNRERRIRREEKGTFMCKKDRKWLLAAIAEWQPLIPPALPEDWVGNGSSCSALPTTQNSQSVMMTRATIGEPSPPSLSLTASCALEQNCTAQL